MKSKIFVLLAVIFVLFGLTTYAAETDELNGFYDIGTYQDVEIKAYSGDTEINATMENLDSDAALELLYEGSNRLEVSYKAAIKDGYYGVLLVEGSELPTKDNKIIYIDQLTAESNTVDFNVYPILPKKATPLSLYISSDVEGFELIKVPLNYYLPMTPYTLGDIDNSGKVTIDDAVTALQFVAQIIEPTDAEKASADVDCSGKVTIDDCVMILQYVAQIIDSWN